MQIKQSIILVTLVLAFFLIFILGVWGYMAIPQECNTLNTYRSMRFLLCIGAVGMTIFISYALCGYYCVDPSPSESLPKWVSIISIILFGMAINYSVQLSKLDTACIGYSYSIVLNISQAVSGLSILVCCYDLFNDAKKAYQKSKKLKNESSSKVSKEEDELSEKIASMEAENEKQESELAKQQIEQKRQLALRSKLESLEAQKKKLAQQASNIELTRIQWAGKNVGIGGIGGTGGTYAQLPDTKGRPLTQ